MMRMRLRLIATLFVLLLSACGWHLRGLDRGERPEQLALVVENRFEPLVLTTQEVLQQNGIRIENDSPLELHIGREELKRRTVAVTSIGSPSQYELTLTVHYHYRSPALKPMVPRVISTKRAFDFDPSNTVAKKEEENTLLSEMRRELAIRLLDSVPSGVAHGQN